MKRYILLTRVHGAIGHGFAYADATMIGETNLHTMMSRLYKVCTELQEWGNTAGLTFNSSKTVLIIFMKKQIKPTEMPNKLKISGQDPVAVRPSCETDLQQLTERRKIKREKREKRKFSK